MLHAIVDGSRAWIDPDGLPVTETEAPEAPDGFRATYRIEPSGDGLAQVWELVPLSGTEQEAAIVVARVLAEGFTDEMALRVPALYPEWSGRGVRYEAGKRVLRNGVLCKVVTAHASQADWPPEAAPSLFARVLPGQSGEAGEWVQPDSTNGYAKGDRVTHLGKTWESDYDGPNVWEPGQPNSHWVEVADGAADA